MSYSFWLDQSSKNSKKTYDVIVVGAGIAGVSTAYWLKKEDPSLSIAIVDKGEISSGATGRNAGFITCGSVEHFNRLVGKHGKEEAQEIWNFSETNLELLKNEILQDSSHLGFSQSGSFSLASTDSELTELKNTARLMEDLKISVEVIDEKGIEERLNAKSFVGGIKYIDDGSVNPVALVEEILKKSGVDFISGTEVFEIEKTGASRILKTNRGDMESSMVVLATNGYSSLLSGFFKDKIFPTRGQVLLLESVEPFMESPCYAHFVLDYFRQLPTGELLIGGFRQLEKETEVGYSDHTTDVIQSALHGFVLKHLPQFKDKKVTHRWAGVMGFSVDGQPMVGSLPEDEQVFFLGGFTAHGLGLAFHGGKCLTDMIFGREIPKFISAKRF